MTKFLKMTSLILLASTLSACYIVPIWDHDRGYHGGHEHHYDGDRREYRDNRR
jgi:hypothetical protein